MQVRYKDTGERRVHPCVLNLDSYSLNQTCWHQEVHTDLNSRHLCCSLEDWQSSILQWQISTWNWDKLEHESKENCRQKCVAWPISVFSFYVLIVEDVSCFPPRPDCCCCAVQVLVNIMDGTEELCGQVVNFSLRVKMHSREQGRGEW